MLEPGEQIQAVMFGKTGPGFWATVLLLGVFALPFVKGYHVCVTDRRVLVFGASLHGGSGSRQSLSDSPTGGSQVAQTDDEWSVAWHDF